MGRRMEGEGEGFYGIREGDLDRRCGGGWGLRGDKGQWELVDCLRIR